MNPIGIGCCDEMCDEYYDPLLADEGKDENQVLQFDFLGRQQPTSAE